MRHPGADTVCYSGQRCPQNHKHSSTSNRNARKKAPPRRRQEIVWLPGSVCSDQRIHHRGVLLSLFENTSRTGPSRPEVRGSRSTAHSPGDAIDFETIAEHRASRVRTRRLRSPPCPSVAVLVCHSRWTGPMRRFKIAEEPISRECRSSRSALAAPRWTRC